jgi:hypothetical protein
MIRSFLLNYLDGLEKSTEAQICFMESARKTGPALLPICMSRSRFNATLRVDQGDGISVDAIPGAITRCPILLIVVVN